MHRTQQNRDPSSAHGAIAVRRGPLTVAGVAELYGVSEPTVLAWIRSGELRAVNVSRRAGSRKPRWRITAMALSAFEVTRAAGAPRPRAAKRKPAGDGVEEFIR